MICCRRANALPDCSHSIWQNDSVKWMKSNSKTPLKRRKFICLAAFMLRLKHELYRNKKTNRMLAGNRRRHKRFNTFMKVRWSESNRDLNSGVEINDTWQYQWWQFMGVFVPWRFFQTHSNTVPKTKSIDSRVDSIFLEKI